MGIREGTTKYILKKPFSYAVQGEQLKAEFIELVEPGQEHASEYFKLKQMIARAQMDLVKSTGQLQKAVDEPIAGEEVKSFRDNAKEIEMESQEMEGMLNVALMSSVSVDVSEFIQVFQKMACKTLRRSVCIVDGVQAMTPGIWSNMNPDDSFNIAIKWCSFFAIAWDEAQKNTSEQQQGSASLVKVV